MTVLQLWEKYIEQQKEEQIKARIAPRLAAEHKRVLALEAYDRMQHELTRSHDDLVHGRIDAKQRSRTEKAIQSYLKAERGE